MHERLIRDDAGKTWSVMVRRVRPQDGASETRAWAVCFRIQGEPTNRTLTELLPDGEPPELAEFTEQALLSMLEPHAVQRAEEEARNRAEDERVRAETRAANAAAKAAKAEAFEQRKKELAELAEAV